MQKALSGDVLIATHMNGKPLPANHGFPVRAVVAGYYGMASVKWLTKIVVLTKPYLGWWQASDYFEWNRTAEQPVMVQLNPMQVKAVFTVPELLSEVPAGKPVKVQGAAWAGENMLATVECSSDGGKTWQPAKLIDPPTKFIWSRFEWEWTAPMQAGGVKLLCRATDAVGNTQPAERSVDRRSYKINHLIAHEVRVVSE
jgi:DMSO/TMAO reductase YedYZ molybdopterin-dependent catalytic subunit